ncbi:MAG: GNAT family N-acetyltransferase [Defluviimonas sp.]|uniref:GNAT family N-acetyltransferase n=1 Tax=Albidovulum sp. TaxID=1872424 RepID=UPI001DD17D8E|nr:GNAT family N-acetyltransferase [Paracoccaceae bacterium]MCC0063754.1 GNAT family N-acetyltransferase [Defluviimonas sp.]
MITIAPLPRDRTEEVLHLELGPGQGAFVHPIADMVTEATPGVAFHVIRDGDLAVGFFKTDCGYCERHDFAPKGAPGLRGFLIGFQYQGRGYGRAAMRALPAYLRRLLPDAEAVYLTVNCANPVARHAYVSGGWEDTGTLYHGGSSGPQAVLRLALGVQVAAAT